MLRDRDPQHWKLGIFYYNPNQSRLFVAKRDGLPMTLNFARPIAWAITAILPAVAIVGFVFDKFHSAR